MRLGRHSQSALIRVNLRQMFRCTAIFVVILALALPLAAEKKPKGAPLVRRPDQTAELKAFWLPTPVQKCTNWAWAVAIEAMLRSQQVTMKQNVWVSKADLGEVCIDVAPTMEKLARVVGGAYVLDDGRHVRLEARYISGAPTIPDDLIAPLRQGRPVLLFWKSRALVVRAVVYDEYIYPNDQRMFQIKEIKLVDPLLTGKERERSFVNGRDDLAEIGGVFEVVVILDKQQKWTPDKQQTW
jgi:thiol-disulfide isomerase/thioredoxin